MAAAIRLCPNLIVVPVRHSQYRHVSRQVMALLRSWTDLVQQISIDEAFLDVTPLVNQDRLGYDIARNIQDQVRDKLGLSCSIGVASNKLVAKIATDYGKAAVGKRHSPRAICVVPPGDEALFLAPLPASALWGVGPKTAQRLSDLGINTIGDLATWPERDLMNRFGKHGYELSQHAKGIDKREVVVERESKSISSETTFIRDIDEWEHLHETLVEQAASVSQQLKKQHLQASTVKIKLRWSDFSTVTRQMTVAPPTSELDVIQKAAEELLRQLKKDDRPVRLLGVGCANFNPVKQLSLWDAVQDEPIDVPIVVGTPEDPEGGQKKKRLQNVVALLNAKYGEQAVQVGSNEPLSHVKDDTEQKVE